MSTDKPHHGNKWMPALYACYFGILKEIAQNHGYALAVHGSFSRDMDLIAVPWIEDVKPQLDMLREFCKAIGIGRTSNELPYDSIEERPHGRTSYTIGTGGGGYVDISIFSTIKKEDL
jgi:hypothetical protein